MNAIQLAEQFILEGQPTTIKPFGDGHINQTLLVRTDAGRAYVLQQINEAVFPDAAAVMSNVTAVTDHIRSRGGRALRYLPARSGDWLWRDGEGRPWRAYEFEEGLCLQTPRSPADFYQSGVAFGQFQQQLVDFPAHRLAETIPDFHNTPVRFAQLKAAVAEDAAGRLGGCEPEVGFYLSQEELGSKLQSLLRAGTLPLRVTHNDTKLNNVLLDEATGTPRCVLDLDTVMPGLSAYDFGDAIRFGAATAAEDAEDAQSMKLDLTLFEAFARGFVSAAPGLTGEELQALPLGAFTMTLECGSRFLADHLKGDAYFKTTKPNHNLLRARTQMALCRDMLKNWPAMEQIISRL